MISAFGGLAQTVSSTIFELLIIALACYSIVNEKLTIGSYVSFNVYLAQFLSSLRVIASMNLNIQTVLVSIDRIDDILECETENFVEDVQSMTIYGNVEIRNLKFSYEDTQKVIDNINIKFPCNTVTSIVGTSGCGKTTIFNLLVRFYECNAGSIVIDGRNINVMPLCTLRNAISYIQQDVFFLSDTVKSNLCLVNCEATDEEIIQACKDAEIYEKIISLPDGFNTILSENASILSSGEKQRLAIARGILKKSKIFLFDEVTSNLDGEAEKKILRTIFHLGRRHTVIVVAHRITLIEKMPRIIVLDKGKLVGEGKHDYLIKNCEIYQKLFEKEKDYV